MQIHLHDSFALRLPKYDDAETLQKHGDDPDVIKQMMDSFEVGYTRQHALIWIDEALSNKPRTRLVITSDDTPIGTISLKLLQGVQSHVAEIGYWIGQSFWGLGVATNAVLAMVNYGFNELELGRIYAHVFSTNPASCRVLEKAGFQKEGLLRNDIRKGEFLDQIVYGILK